MKLIVYDELMDEDCLSIYIKDYEKLGKTFIEDNTLRIIEGPAGPVLTIEIDKGGRVPAMIYEINGEKIEVLDVICGVNNKFLKEHPRVRETKEMQVDGKMIKAETYLANPKFNRYTSIKPADIKFLKEVYEKIGFDSNYLKQIVAENELLQKAQSGALAYFEMQYGHIREKLMAEEVQIVKENELHRLKGNELCQC